MLLFVQHLCTTWQAGPPRLQQYKAASSSANLSSFSSSSNTAVDNAAAATAGRANGSAASSGSIGSNAAAAVSATAASDLEYDGILGFSNGAAAAFLFAAHAAAHPDYFRSLRFVALASGYVPEPQDKLVPYKLIRKGHSNTLSHNIITARDTPDDNSGNNSDNCDGFVTEDDNVISEYDNVILEVPPCERLSTKLPYPSLHMMGRNDPLIDVAESSKLIECFQECGRWVRRLVIAFCLPYVFESQFEGHYFF